MALLKFIFVSSLGVGLNPVLQIFKPYDSGFGTLFQIHELLGPFQKSGLPPDLCNSHSPRLNIAAKF